MRATTMVIDTEKYKENMKKIQKYVGNKILMPVIKANAYGTYINENLSIINKYEIVAVAVTDEAKRIREIGYTKEIFVLNQPYKEDIDDIIKYNVTIGISEKEFVKELNKRKEKIKVHLEIETGMNRTGIKLKDLESFINLIKDTNIVVDGVYTHLSSADFDKEYTNKQLEIFKEAVNIVKKHYKNITYIHSSASNGLLNYKEDVSNTVRPGIIMYGYESYEGVKKQIDIEPIAKLKTKIIYMKEVEKRDAISYSQKYIAESNKKIATIPIGYADGLRRALSNKGTVVVNGKLAKIVGNVCMDSCMIDVTDIDCKINDDVYIWDNDKVLLEDISNICNTINYEIICTISNRVPRVFK